MQLGSESGEGHVGRGIDQIFHCYLVCCAAYLAYLNIYSTVSVGGRLILLVPPSAFAAACDAFSISPPAAPLDKTAIYLIKLRMMTLIIRSFIRYKLLRGFVYNKTTNCNIYNS